LRRVFAPLLASFKPTADAVELWLTNDLPHSVSDRVTVTLGTFAGAVDWQEMRDVRITARTSACVWRQSLTGSADRFLWVEFESGAFPPNRHFFAEVKDLRRTPVAPTLSVMASADHELRLRLSAPPDGYVFFAHLTSPHETTRFSDNYFDVPPAASRDLVVTDPTRDLTPETLHLGWA
jgi:beta-mannosidase